MDFSCLDCGVDTQAINEYYTINDDLWLQIHPEDNGILCIGCVETRAGRLLTPADFPRYPINTGYFAQSERLLNRLGRG